MDACRCGAVHTDSQLGSEKVLDCLGWAIGHSCAHLEGAGAEANAVLWRDACYICRMRLVCRELRRVLRNDGVMWWNHGCSWNGGNMDAQPWKLALAIQQDGWLLCQAMPWVKRCLSGGTWLYARTQKGDMPVMVKDLVRLKPETVQLWNGEKWTQVLGFHESRPTVVGEERRKESRRRISDRVAGREVELTGDLEIEFRSGERVACTRVHEWPTQRGVVQAADLRIGDVVPSVKIPEPDNLLSPPLLDDELTGWVVGLYLAEGFLVGDGKVKFTVHVKEKEYYRKVRRLVTAFGDSTKWNPRETCNTADFVAYGKLFEAFIREYVTDGDCYTKRLTTKAWQRSEVFLRAVAVGYLDGDGGKDPANNRWRLGFCNNDGLAVDLRTLAARVGARIRLKRTISKWKDKEAPAWKGEWRFDLPSPSSEQGEIVAIRAARSRKFWDISVADEPNVFVLASGLLTHNSPMPESIKNRPAKALEEIFMFAKRPGYFYDHVAIRMVSATEPHSPGWAMSMPDRNDRQVDNESNNRNWGETGSRNFWNADLWFDSVDKPHGLCGVGEELVGLDVTSGGGFKGAHFAVFPRGLVEPLLKAGTSQHGACMKCGAPWQRVTETRQLKRDRPNDLTKRTGEEGTGNHCGNTVAGVSTRTVGWRPDCTCHGQLVKKRVKKHVRIIDVAGKKSGARIEQGMNSTSTTLTSRGFTGDAVEAHDEEREVTVVEYVSDLPLEDHPVRPCIVLDPFCGSGTALVVALEHGRWAWGIDLSEAYLQRFAIPQVKAALWAKGLGDLAGPSDDEPPPRRLKLGKH